ncbi:Anoctamin-8 (Transmembrane protein 16H) [Durusdinium trenchii]|uniref:Anoctamin-8 (Transmembrane protein 16H) n=1 Tax=Durusdinium trenchii TaxID=1381693 RepID=A0ABP0MQI7_9DINO
MTQHGHPPPPKGVAAAKSKAKQAAEQSGTAGLTEAQMMALREKFDLDGDQMLTLSEFKGLARQVAQMQGHPAPSYSVLEDIFDEFDTDFTGKMGGEEFNWAYATLQLKLKEEATKEASRIVKLSIDRASGRKLGLSLDEKTLEVKDVKSDGLVAEWNYANPTRALQIGHKIKKVNGKPGLAGYSEELMNSSVPVLKIEAVPSSHMQKPPRFYTIRLDRSSGGKLGMQLEQPSLEIQNLAVGGLACKWNQEHPKERIRPGDSIVRVNDKDGMAGFKEVMMNPSVLVLDVQIAPLSRYHEEDDEITSESSVLTDEEEALERYKVIIQAMQELSEAEKKRRANAEKRRLKAIREGKDTLRKLEASSADFYRQMASATLPEDLTVQAEEERRRRLAIEESRRQEERPASSLLPKMPSYDLDDASSTPSGRSTFACPCCGRLFHVFMEGGRYHAVVAHGVELHGQNLALLPSPGPPAATGGRLATPAQALEPPEAIWMALTPVDRIQRYFGSEVVPWAETWEAVVHFFGFTVDDDPFLPFYSLFVVFWGMCFLRSWDRHCAVQAWHWNVHGVENRPEHRAEFVGELRTSRVTGQLHRYYPEGKRFLAYALSVSWISFCVMICSLNLQGFMEESVTSLEQIFYIAPLARLADHGAIFDPNQKEYFGLLAFGPIVLHVFAIMNLNKLYRSVAEWLTEQENHELLEHHQSSLMAKRFMFEAFDCYIVLFYVGFVQQETFESYDKSCCVCMAWTACGEWLGQQDPGLCGEYPSSRVELSWSMWKGGQWLYQVEVSRRRAFVFQVLELISKRQLSRKEMACQADGSCEKPKNKGGGVVLLQGVKRHGKVQEHLQSEDEECTPLGGDPYYPYFRECCQGTKQCGELGRLVLRVSAAQSRKHSCNKKEKEDDCWSTTVQKCRPESTTSEAEAKDGSAVRDGLVRKEPRRLKHMSEVAMSTLLKAEESRKEQGVRGDLLNPMSQDWSGWNLLECRDKTSTTVSTASTTTGPTTTWTGGTGPTPTVLTIMWSWNVFFGNTRYDAMDRMFKAHDVDIANLQEKRNHGETNNKLANIAEASGYASVNEWKQPHDWCGYNFHKPDWGHAWATELEVPGSRGVCGAMMYKGDAKFCVWGLHPIQRNNNVKYAKESIKIAADAMKKCSEEYNAPSKLRSVKWGYPLTKHHVVGWIFLGDFNTLDWRGAQHELEKRTGWGWPLGGVAAALGGVWMVISSQIVGDGTCWLEQAHFLEALEVLDQPHYEQFDDFLEMVIEFGYVTLFASAFPLAAVVSLVSNLIELKSDMFKLACVYQRPISHRMKSIGIWRQLLHIIAGISIITNVMIFVMSEQLASWTPSLYREASLEDVQQGRRRRCSTVEPKGTTTKWRDMQTSLGGKKGHTNLT